MIHRETLQSVRQIGIESIFIYANSMPSPAEILVHTVKVSGRIFLRQIVNASSKEAVRFDVRGTL